MVRKIILVISFTLAICSNLFPQRICGTMDYLHNQELNDPQVKLALQQLQDYTNKWVTTYPDYLIKGRTNVVTIPVVVHIVWNSSDQNLPNQRIYEQIEILNRDYSGQNPHSMGGFPNSLKTNTLIQFVLAKTAPDGNPTNGILRIHTNKTSFTKNDDAVKFTAQGGDNAWDPNKYLNIWICKLSGGLCGYAQFPYQSRSGGVNSTYGLVIHYEYFGLTGTTYPYNGGGTTSHELGHCFNLFHIWGDDSSNPYQCTSGNCCEGIDYCNDTPNQSVATSGAPTGIVVDAWSSNSPGINYQDFMDYTFDEAYANFTPDQALRMQACFAEGGPLYSLANSNIGDTLIKPNLTKLEYFIDTDPGFGNGVSVSITPSPDITQNFNIPLNTVSNGIHIFFIRAKDANGKWSFTNKLHLYRFSCQNPLVQKIEYFIDTDPGWDNGNQLSITPATTVEKNFSIPLTNLSDGFHKLYIRAKNENAWGIIEIQHFYKFSPISSVLTKLEYFIDSDPGIGNGTNIPVNQSVNATELFNIPLSNITNGIHTLYIRAKQNNGSWSIVQTSAFYKMEFEEKLIDKIEYFVDNDPGWGMATEVLIPQPSSSISQSFIADLSCYPAGDHKIYYRTHDSNGRWSLTNIKQITITYTPAFITVIGSTSLCEGETVILKVPSAAGRTYQWLKNGNLIPGATDSIYIASQTGAYRAIINHHNICQDTTSFVQVNVSQHTVGGYVSGGSTICLGSSTGTLSLNNYTGNIIRWQKRLNGTNWITINNTNPTYSETPSQKGNWEYRAEIKSGVCPSEYSGSTTVVVNTITVAGTITGTSTVCQGQQGIVYTIPAIETATGYVWSLPSGATIISGNNTNSITVNYSTTAVSGNITVCGVNICGNGTPSPAFAVTVNPLPGNAGTITGLSSVCKGQNNIIYTVPAITYATGYNWTLPEGTSIIAGANSNSITVNFSASAVSGNIFVNGTNNCGNGETSPLFIVNVNTVPDQAGIISGTDTVCQGQSNVMYSISQIPNTTGYVWDLPTGAVIVNGDNTNTITVNYSTTALPGNISVYGTNECGNGIASPNFAVTVNPLPGVSGTIIGQTTVCQGQTNVNYSVPTIANSTGYVWTVPIDATIIAGNNTNNIFVNYATTALSGNIFVYGTNDCGNGTVSPNFAVTVNPLPGTAGTIIGSSIVCQGQNNVNYSVPAIANATGYFWSLPAGAMIVTGNNTNSITVNYSNIAVSGNISVYGTNNCGNGIASSNFAVTVNPLPGEAGVITGQSTVCQGQTGVNYSIPEIANATGYIWTIPSGATLVSGNNTNSITVNYSNTATSGNVTVYGTNNCGNGTISPNFAIMVNPLPGAPGTIAGTTTVCQGQNNVSYSVPIITNATGYIWSLPSGATIISGNNTNSIIVNYSSTALSGNISVHGTNDCGNGSLSPPLQIFVNTIPNGTGNIQGNSNVCQGQTGVVYSIQTVTNATGYIWTLPIGAIIESGANTNSITVNFSSDALSGNISVYATNDCGNGISSPDFWVTISPLPATAGTIIGSTTVCQGQNNVNYSVPVITNATDYIWSLPSGATIIAGNNTNAITVNYTTIALSGIVSVHGSNDCGNGTGSPDLVVTVNPLPGATGSITGPATVCQGQSGLVYSVPAIANATEYVWTIPAGITILSGANTNTIKIKIANAAASGILTVYGVNSCGNGPTSSEFTISVLPSHFQFVGGNTFNPTWSIYLNHATLDNNDLQPMDEIAIFDGTTMVGMLTLTEAPSPENVTDNYITAFQTLANGSGYIPGHSFTFKCWNANAQTEISIANVTLLNPYGDAWTGNVFPNGDGQYSIAELDFLATVTQSFALNTGYQFISSYVTPSNPDMSVVLAELMNNNLSFVRSSGGNMFRKLGPNWINNIGDWIVTEGYLVKMNAPDDFDITGIRVNPLTPINLNTGYQFISYFHDYPMDASTAFTEIMNDNLSFIRNSAGNMLRKLGPNWVNNIGNVIPGEGYLVKMNAPATLIYPAGTKSESTKNNVAIQHFNFEGGNAADPVYTIYISDATINGYNLQAGDEIGVFDGQTVVGSLALTQTPTADNQTENAIPVFATLNSGEGFTANHQVTFKLWSQGQEYDGVNVTLSNPYGDAYTGKVFPNSDGVYSIASLTATLTGINSLDRREVAVYPNPNNGQFTLELNSVKSQNFDVTIYNSLGVVVYRQLNVAANGKYLAEIISGNLPEGIYTLTVTGKDANYIRKIVIRK